MVRRLIAIKSSPAASSNWWLWRARDDDRPSNALGSQRGLLGPRDQPGGWVDRGGGITAGVRRHIGRLARSPHIGAVEPAGENPAVPRQTQVVVRSRRDAARPLIVVNCTVWIAVETASSSGCQISTCYGNTLRTCVSGDWGSHMPFESPMIQRGRLPVLATA